ncbi:hypothetical protein Ga0451573_002602 [Peptococcaceae bacterium DYL19]|nr:hypothetical protein [Phosphitispora fastidiosa]
MKNGYVSEGDAIESGVAGSMAGTNNSVIEISGID